MGVNSDFNLGIKAANLVWQADPTADQIIVPETSEFATTVISELTRLLDETPGVLKRMMEGATAAAAAADLNIDQYQGIIEVLQNADDIGASQVRMAYRVTGKQKQLLVTHDGELVTFHHVLAMAL